MRAYTFDDGTPIRTVIYQKFRRSIAEADAGDLAFGMVLASMVLLCVTLCLVTTVAVVVMGIRALIGLF